MEKNNAPEERNRQKAGKSKAEIPPQQNRKHLTEPTWVENMIYLTGVLLGKETQEDPPAKSKSSKSEAA